MNGLRNRKLNRLDRYDYSRDNCYFVTSCVKDKAPVFVAISNGKMELNVQGEIARKQLSALEERYEYVKIHSFVIMPDHMHAVIEINSNQVENINDMSMPKIKSLSELMGVFKMTSSKEIRLSGMPSFEWQRSFHDRIIRDERAYQNILRYIENNPANWRRK